MYNIMFIRLDADQTQHSYTPSYLQQPLTPCHRLRHTVPRCSCPVSSASVCTRPPSCSVTRHCAMSERLHTRPAKNVKYVIDQNNQISIYLYTYIHYILLYIYLHTHGHVIHVHMYNSCINYLSIQYSVLKSLFMFVSFCKMFE